MKESLSDLWADNTGYFEYTAAANLRMPAIGIESFPAAMHQINESRVSPLDLSSSLDTNVGTLQFIAQADPPKSASA